MKKNGKNKVIGLNSKDKYIGIEGNVKDRKV